MTGASHWAMAPCIKPRWIGHTTRVRLRQFQQGAMPQAYLLRVTTAPKARAKSQFAQKRYQPGDGLGRPGTGVHGCPIT